MKESSDSKEVVEFLSLFGQIKKRVNGDPKRITFLADNDDNFRDLCARANDAHFFIDYLSKSRRNAFAAPAYPDFVRGWRDFEENYLPLVSRYWLVDVLLDPDDQSLPASAPSSSKKVSTQELSKNKFEIADEEAERLQRGLDDIVEFAMQEIELNDFVTDDHMQSLIEGRGAWSGLSKTLGFDIRGAFRRRGLLSMILVPRHVAAKHGLEEPLSLYSYLREAQDAFVRGTPNACLVLMRSILELVLRDHYGMKEIRNGRDELGLEKKITRCASLPDRLSKERLLKLKRMAD